MKCTDDTLFQSDLLDDKQKQTDSLWLNIFLYRFKYSFKIMGLILWGGNEVETTECWE